MADINVERRSPSVWPWIVGLLILALLIWALVEIFGGEADSVLTDPIIDSVMAGPGTTPSTASPAPFPATSDTAFGGVDGSAATSDVQETTADTP